MLNWSRVEELKVDLGEEDFQEISSLFLEEVEEKLADLACDTPDTLAADLHFLKGSAANLGFEGFREMCEQLERAPDRLQLGALVSLFKTSKSAFLEGMQT